METISWDVSSVSATFAKFTGTRLVSVRFVSGAGTRDVNREKIKREGEKEDDVEIEDGEEEEGEKGGSWEAGKRKLGVGGEVEGDGDKRKKIKKEEIDEGHAEEKDSKHGGLQGGVASTSSDSLQEVTGQVGGIKTEQQDI
ncbi:MAG: hypothetical protein Q9205_004386 [Flavoplaca limonia]